MTSPPDEPTSLPETEPRALIRRVAISLIGAAVVASVVLVIVDQVASFPDVPIRFAPGWILVAVGALFVFLAVPAELWRAMIATLGSSVRAWPGRALYFASVLARYVPTGLLSVVVRIGLAEREGVPRRVSGASLVYEIVLNIAAGILIGCWFFISLPALSGEPSRWLILPVAITGIVALHPRIFGPLANAALRKAKRPPLEVVLPFGWVLFYLVAYAALMVVAGLGVLATVSMLSPVAAEDVPIAIGSYAIGFVVGMFGAILPGGLGAREGGMALVLAPTFGATIAVAAAIGVRLIQVALELGYTALCTAVARGHGAPQAAG